jgi:hypothetical protein
MRGSLSMNAHCRRMGSSADSGSEASRWVSSPKDPINGDIVRGEPTLGVGAPYVPHPAFRA